MAQDEFAQRRSRLQDRLASSTEIDEQVDNYFKDEDEGVPIREEDI